MYEEEYILPMSLKIAIGKSNVFMLCISAIRWYHFPEWNKEVFHSVSSLSFLWNDIFELTFWVLDMGSVNGYSLYTFVRQTRQLSLFKSEVTCVLAMTQPLFLAAASLWITKSNDFSQSITCHNVCSKARVITCVVKLVAFVLMLEKKRCQRK